MNESTGNRPDAAAATRPRSTWPWYAAASIPVVLLLCLFALTSYGIPESDDFCLSSLYQENGFVGAIVHFYYALSGRVAPLFLIQLPAAIHRATGIDFLTSYAAMLAALMLLLFAGMLYFSARLSTGSSAARTVFLAAGLSAVMLSEMPSLRELLYWLPGVTCYTIPGIILVIVLNELVRSAETGDRLTPTMTGFLAAGCFIASLCNEFTPVSLVALVLGSLVFRAFNRMPLQAPEHAVIAGAALLGFLIVIAAPGNTVRMAQFPAAGLLFHSLAEAFRYAFSNLMKLMARPVVPAWLIVVTLYVATEPAPAAASAARRRWLAAAVLLFCLGSGYLAYFAHEYSTGLRLSERAQNQMVMLLVCALTISTVMLARASRDWLRLQLSRGIPQQIGPPSVAVPLIIAVALLLPTLYFSKTARLIRFEQATFQTFWNESVDRHQRLGRPTPMDIVAPPHTVLPTILMGGDITDVPDRLPNDCIARFYGKKSLVVERRGMPAR
jgi:hypothetical protein